MIDTLLEPKNARFPVDESDKTDSLTAISNRLIEFKIDISSVAIQRSYKRWISRNEFYVNRMMNQLDIEGFNEVNLAFVFGPAFLKSEVLPMLKSIIRGEEHSSRHAMLGRLKGGVASKIAHVDKSISSIIEEMNESSGGIDNVNFVKLVYSEIRQNFATSFNVSLQTNIGACRSLVQLFNSQVQYHSIYVSEKVARLTGLLTVNLVMALSDAQTTMEIGELVKSARSNLYDICDAMCIGGLTKKKCFRSMMENATKFADGDQDIEMTMMETESLVFDLVSGFFTHAAQDTKSHIVAMDREYMSFMGEILDRDVSSMRMGIAKSMSDMIVVSR